jgi:hypothetical protein
VSPVRIESFGDRCESGSRRPEEAAKAVIATEGQPNPRPCRLFVGPRRGFEDPAGGGA